MQRPPEVNSELGCIQKSLKPRGPYSYEKELSKFPKSARSNKSHAPATFVYIRKPINYGKNNSIGSTPVPALSKCIYLSEVSDNNPLPFQSTLSTLFYTSNVKKMPRYQCPQQTNINVIHVRGLPTPAIEDDFPDI